MKDLLRRLNDIDNNSEIKKHALCNRFLRKYVKFNSKRFQFQQRTWRVVSAHIKLDKQIFPNSAEILFKCQLLTDPNHTKFFAEPQIKSLTKGRTGRK